MPSKGLVPRYSRFLLSVLSLVLLLAACAVPAATPTTTTTPTPAPTATPTPTPALAPTPRGTPPPPVTADLTGRIDATTGALTEDVVIFSSDGRARLAMPDESVLLNEQGQPLKSITITPLVPPQSNEGVVVGWAYAFSDPWTNGTLRPPGTITLSYVPPPANPRIDVTKPQIAGWWEPKKSWVSRPDATTAGSTPSTITSRQGYIQTVVVIFWYVDIAVPVS